MNGRDVCTFVNKTAVAGSESVIINDVFSVTKLQQIRTKITRFELDVISVINLYLSLINKDLYLLDLT